MMDEEKECFDVLPQLKAVKAGLEKCIALYLQQQMDHCFASKQSVSSKKDKMSQMLLELAKL